MLASRAVGVPPSASRADLLNVVPVELVDSGIFLN
jgi:hypothetical protein